MSIFPIIADDALVASVSDVFDEIDDKLGSIPIIYRLLAFAPPLVEAYWLNYQKVILEGVLSPQVKELIFLSVARKRRCIYCSSTYLVICDAFGTDRQTLTAIMAGTIDFEPKRFAALIRFCLLSMDDPDAVSRNDYQLLYEQGISQDEALEALYTVSYADTGTFLAKAIKIDVDVEVKSYLDEHNLDIGFS
ncbi:MAG: carboxymuconolactone decarboxylase family protein [Colwellia sp.]|nr:carboxymuconolactone decarboxylase family protein [Colwellia sp.]